MAPAIERETLRRIVASLVATEIGRGRNLDPVGRAEDPAAWTDEEALSVGSIVLDSLETMYAAAAVHEMFGSDNAEEDHPRRSPVTVGEWLDDISLAQSRENARLTVMTSGSTGRPKPCVHAVTDLQDEAAYFCERLPSIKRVVALVPAHHIYGLIWTALLPARLGIPVISASAANLPRLQDEDLIVAVPDQWVAILRSRICWPLKVCGVSAGAPLDDRVASELLGAGLHHLYDVYGSSETGGIAVREAPNAAYVLLPRWRFASPPGAATSVLIDRLGRGVQLPDHLAIKGDASFTVLGRRDGAVQVGGLNVWTEYVASVLRRCPGVADITVRLGDHGRLKAFIVPAEAGDETALLDGLRRHAMRLLTSEQRPTSFSFGVTAPRNILGKRCDWS
ncbi:AMP-binding protein [Sphingosinicellaceae bacterium]|nr:AMP-binding protein [Sphingosinicellaceae bacterium]